MEIYEDLPYFIVSKGIDGIRRTEIAYIRTPLNINVFKGYGRVRRR